MAVILTGIKATGKPHLGNYLGAMRPALTLADQYETRYFFIADYHALNAVKDAGVLRSHIYEVAAAWLAAGLDPDRVVIYKQSDVPETFELTTALMAFTAKGLMNRAHAYKAAVDVNREKKRSDDHQVNMGLYTYPVLMAADILLFDTDYVPVGGDQVQHVEMAQDIAEVVNHNYGKKLLNIPRAIVDDAQNIVPGLDGRKMSNSYDNHIPLFLPEKKLKKMVGKIVTNSQSVEEVKDPETCTVFRLYTLFASKEEQKTLAARYQAGGMGWGEAKAALFEKLNGVLSPMRERYETLMADKARIDAVLDAGASKAGTVAGRTMDRLRKAMGVD